jgi:trehalose 6-phosphate phosphatase
MTADPSVAEHAARLAERADEVALCLDFDGTLSPIVDDPEAARPLPGTVELLGQLAARFAAAALISGRSAAYLAEHAAAPGVRYLRLYGPAGDPRRPGVGRPAPRGRQVGGRGSP